MSYLGAGITRFNTADDLTVTDDATIQDDASVGGDLTVTGTTTLNGAVNGVDKIEEGNSSVEVVDTGTGSIQFDVDGSEVARLNSTGLGVGTTSPNSRLEVAGDASPIVTIKSTSGPYSEILSNTVGSLLLRADQGDTGASTNCSIYVDGDLEFRATPGFISFNSGYGSVATAYGCRAWVNFDGTSTPSIRGSGNVTSITDNGTGDYTVNFTSNMPDNDYAVTGASAAVSVVTSGGDFNYTTGSVRVFPVNSSGSAIDTAYVFVAIFR